MRPGSGGRPALLCIVDRPGDDARPLMGVGAVGARNFAPRHQKDVPLDLNLPHDVLGQRKPFCGRQAVVPEQNSDGPDILDRRQTA